MEVDILRNKLEDVDGNAVEEELESVEPTAFTKVVLTSKESTFLYADCIMLTSRFECAPELRMAADQPKAVQSSSGSTITWKPMSQVYAKMNG